MRALKLKQAITIYTKIKSIDIVKMISNHLIKKKNFRGLTLMIMKKVKNLKISFSKIQENKDREIALHNLTIQNPLIISKITSIAQEILSI